ncbi:MAG: M1 family aminopeptidase, partial [Gammaproteobacteria bacterium]
MTKTPTTKYLNDYKPSNFLLNTVNLVFDLYEDKTIVTAELNVFKNPNENGDHLELVGNSLKLLELKLDDEVLAKVAYDVSPSQLVIKNPPKEFKLTIVTEIHPEKNTELMGLYKSKKMFCTQCEPEGFRRITYFLDRPDVIAVFTTTINADKSLYPILLSNGNLVENKILDQDRHSVTWHDPTKKPSYLFALVAAELACLEDEFVTQSGKNVMLRLYVEHGNLDKATHAMFALKAAMKWDEMTFGREYDLDIYMIVAVSDFNMGAMENKGLNIFNTKYVLANPETATDDDYQAIIGVIGHEYFHNWTGN